MGTMQERITTTKKGSITSVQVRSSYPFANVHCIMVTFPQAIFVPADDLTDPAPATTFAHLDAMTVLSRAISELGIYPAVDPLDSTSRIMDPNVVGQEHYDIARGVQKVLQVNYNHYCVLGIKCCLHNRTINLYKTSLLFWEWMNCQKMIN